MGSLGGFEWLVIILVVLLLFGAKKIPELARGLGQGINEFKRASKDIKKEIDAGKNETNQTDKQEERTSQTQSGTSS
ncbi:MAG TPA: twin-arginine translocase TatA/TatE family subunit [Balneolales bacterium]|nr:twin-arginine translocase TatA/TatE family subunit [Balneolales bacterium]